MGSWCQRHSAAVVTLCVLSQQPHLWGATEKTVRAQSRLTGSREGSCLCNKSKNWVYSGADTPKPAWSQLNTTQTKTGPRDSCSAHFQFSFSPATVGASSNVSKLESLAGTAAVPLQTNPTCRSNTAVSSSNQLCSPQGVSRNNPMSPKLRKMGQKTQLCWSEAVSPAPRAPSRQGKEATGVLLTCGFKKEHPREHSALLLLQQTFKKVFIW